MDRNEIMEKLNSLLEACKAYDIAVQRENYAKRMLEEAEDYKPVRVDNFDLVNKERFIKEQVGEEPKKLNKWNPINHLDKRKREYKNQLDVYNHAVKNAINEYLSTYREQRELLMQEDEADKARKLKKAQEILSDAVKEREHAELSLNNNNAVPNTLKKTIVIEQIVSYFSENRCDTLKEGINLFYDEKYKIEQARLAKEHREKIELLLEKQSERIEKITEIANEASETAEEAYGLAREAMSIAEEARNSSSNNYNLL